MKTLLTLLFVLAFSIAWAGISPSCTSVQASPSSSSQHVPATEASIKSAPLEKSTVTVQSLAAPKSVDGDAVIQTPSEAKPTKKNITKKVGSNNAPSVAPILPLLMCSPAFLNRIYSEKPSEG